MNECGISDLQDRSALRDVLQMNMELDLNLGTVIQAYDKQKIDTKDIQQVRSKVSIDAYRLPVRGILKLSI